MGRMIPFAIPLVLVLLGCLVYLVRQHTSLSPSVENAQRHGDRVQAELLAKSVRLLERSVHDPVYGTTTEHREAAEAIINAYYKD